MSISTTDFGYIPRKYFMSPTKYIKKMQPWDSAIHQAWNFSSIMHWLLVVLRVRLGMDSFKGWAKRKENKLINKRPPSCFGILWGNGKYSLLSQVLLQLFDKQTNKNTKVKNPNLFVNTNSSDSENLFVEKIQGR